MSVLEASRHINIDLHGLGSQDHAHQTVVITETSLTGSVTLGRSLTGSVTLRSSTVTGHCRAPPALRPSVQLAAPGRPQRTVCTTPASTPHSAAQRASKHFTLHTLHHHQLGYRTINLNLQLSCLASSEKINQCQSNDCLLSNEN